MENGSKSNNLWPRPHKKGFHMNQITKTDQFLIEIAEILRGDHLGYYGDAVSNTQGFINRFCRDFEDCQAVGDDIERNIRAASEISRLSPDRLTWIVNRIRERKIQDRERARDLLLMVRGE